MYNGLIQYIREQFPSLQRTVGGKLIAYLDGPGGYQVPTRVLSAMERYLTTMNANSGAQYLTSRETDEMIQRAREAFGDFFNCSWEEVAFGTNMTTLNFMLAQALAREMHSGDKVLITEIDHDANRAPWLELRERGIVVEEVRVDTETCTLDMADYEKKLTKNTKLVACSYAANAVGTINDVEAVVSMAHQCGAFAVIDSVHYAAHGPINVKAIDTDFLLCSAYKLFGPHIGILYARKDTFDKLRTLKCKFQKNYPPYKIETGTLNHEGIAGAAEALEFVADIGVRFGQELHACNKKPETRRDKLISGLNVFHSYEQRLTSYLLRELSAIEEVSIYGPPEGYPRTSTVSFTYGTCTARRIAQYLDTKGIFVWDGDFSATRLIERLELVDRGGLVRIGIAPYNTKTELERLIASLKDKATLVNFLKHRNERRN